MTSTLMNVNQLYICGNLEAVYDENLTGTAFAFLEKQDVLAILPTGFINSYINQSCTIAKSDIDAVVPSAIIIMLYGKGLLQQTITWYKISNAGGQAHYYSPTETLKQRLVKLDWFRSLCFNFSVGE